MGVQIQTNSSFTVASNMDALFYALKELTSKHTITKVNDVPFLFSGFSAGGKISYSYALEKKSSTIAFANIKGLLFDENTAISTVPGLIITGELEGSVRTDYLRNAFYSYRNGQSVVCFAIEPNSGHSIDNSNTLVRAFFSAVLKKRFVNGALVN